MNKKTIITILLALIAMTGQAQEERIDTVIPKFLSNGYFFREMPQLPKVLLVTSGDWYLIFSSNTLPFFTLQSTCKITTKNKEDTENNDSTNSKQS